MLACLFAGFHGATCEPLGVPCAAAQVHPFRIGAHHQAGLPLAGVVKAAALDLGLGTDEGNDLDIGELSNSFLNLLRSATGLASAITDALVPALQTFYRESGLKDIVIWIGEKFAEGMDGLAGKLDEWAQWFKDNKENIADFAGRLG